MEEAKTVMLIDGNLIARKSLYSVDLALFDGTQVGVIYGCLNTLISLNNRFDPDRIIWCWDGSSQRRKAISPDYKENRVVFEQEDIGKTFYQQLGVTERLMTMMGIDQAYDENEEADDIIGSLVKEFAFSKSGIIIVSNDYDFFQLVDERTMLYWSRKDLDTVWSYNKIKEEYGITPQQFVDVYSLAGDKTDNIIGVEGIGEKTAIKLIKEYGTIEKILETDTKKALKIKEQKDLVMKNRQLVKIKDDLPIKLIRGKLELDTVKDMFTNWLKFKSLLDRWDEVEKLGKKSEQLTL